MTEKEAIKLVKKQNRQYRNERFKDSFSEGVLPLIIGLAVAAFMFWPLITWGTLGDSAPEWFRTFVAIWFDAICLGPIFALFVYVVIGCINDKRKEFKRQVQEELRIAKHREELAPKIEQWLVAHGYRNTDRYTITDIWLHHDYNIGNCRYRDKEFSNPDLELFLHINLDKEENEQDEGQN